jgi:ethanolamine utilization protein EutA
MVSLGLDVGTTTTHQALWRLDPLGEGWGPARLLAESPIWPTPWREGDRIDVEALVRLHGDWLADVLRRTGVVGMGAALITGDAARSPDAHRILDELGTLCGGLVGSLAGGRMESLLAGRASGAQRDARSRLRRSACLDVGGGTANAAIFHPDGSSRAANLRIGGRMVRLDAQERIISRTDVAARVGASVGFDLRPGSVLGALERMALCDAAVSLCLGALEGNAPDWVFESPWDRLPVEAWDVLYLCGGVGEVARRPPASPLLWGDIGPDLGAAFVRAVPPERLRVPATAAIRTTVSGVASCLHRLSGSTVWDQRGDEAVRGFAVRELDLRTAPIGPCADAPAPETRGDFAWSIRMPEIVDWAGLRSLARLLWAATTGRALVALVDRDLGRALGRALRMESADRPALVLDRLEAREGDLLDVGPALENGTVAVTIRSLVWPDTL